MQISQSEKELMDILWAQASENKPLSAKCIIESLDPSLGWHNKTVKSLLSRLLKKQAINFEKKGREYFYYSILDKEKYLEDASENFVKRVFGGNVSALVASFAKQEKLSDEDVAEIKKLIKDIEK